MAADRSTTNVAFGAGGLPVFVLFHDCISIGEEGKNKKNFPDIMHTIENLRSVYWNSIGAPAMMMPTTGYAFTESLVNTFSFSGCHGRFLSCTVIVFWETRGKQSRPIV